VWCTLIKLVHDHIQADLFGGKGQDKKIKRKKRHIAEVFNAPPQCQQASFLMPEVTIFTSPNAVTLCWCEKGILGQPYSAPFPYVCFPLREGLLCANV